jgi:hypothetical protein
LAASFDGKRIRDHLGAEVNALIATYDQFSTLLPDDLTEGAEHRGEDGRFVETLIRSYLRRLLPRELEVLTGFIVRPAVKTGISGYERRGQTDQHSGQLDIMVVDTANYPVFQRFDDSVIVPPEGVIAIFSVKKHLRDSDIATECAALSRAAQLCRCIDAANQPVRGPYLGLLAVRSFVKKQVTATHDWMFQQLKGAYVADSPPCFEDLIGLVGVLDKGCIFKKRPIGKNPTRAEFIWVTYDETERHYALQMALTGVLSVYFDPTRNRRRRPGFSGFASGRAHDGKLGTIEVRGMW